VCSSDLDGAHLVVILPSPDSLLVLVVVLEGKQLL
jgi:hypothetical protein